MKKTLKLFITLILIIMISLLIQTTAFAFPSLVPVEIEDESIDDDSNASLVYEVNTLASGINRADQLIVDDDDNLYYINFYNNIDNKLMTIIDGVVTILADGGSDQSRVLDLINLVYDKANDRVLLLCNVNSGYYTYNANFIGTSAVYDINDLTAPIATFQSGYFTFFNNPIMIGNRIINNGLMFDLDTSEATIFIGGYNAMHGNLINNKYVTFSGIFQEFNLSLNKEIDILVDFNDATLINSITSYKDKFYLYSQDTKTFYEVDITNKNPEAKIFISGDGLVINDFLPFGSVDAFTFTDDGDIIFYDSMNKSIRVISIPEDEKLNNEDINEFNQLLNIGGNNNE